jgi:hypothetical protein
LSWTKHQGHYGAVAPAVAQGIEYGGDLLACHRDICLSTHAHLMAYTPSYKTTIEQVLFGQACIFMVYFCTRFYLSTGQHIQTESELENAFSNPNE